MTKPWYKSKTIMLGIAAIVTGVVMDIIGGDVEGVVGITMAIAGAVMAIMRTITTTGVTPTAEQSPTVRE